MLLKKQQKNKFKFQQSFAKNLITSIKSANEVNISLYFGIHNNL